MSRPKERTPQEELLETGSVTLTADSRQAIYDQCQTLVDSLPEGTRWDRTLCQYHPASSMYEQTVTITKQ